MITIDINEYFPLTAGLIDDVSSLAITGEQVYYDIRKQPGDTVTVSGILTESLVEPGVYSTVLSLDSSGTYTAYVVCPGFASSTENIIVKEENIYDLVKNNRQCNISVEDVVRSNDIPTASQVARNVPKDCTDYIINKIKAYDADDWSNPVASGTIFAHYLSTSDTLPYKMGGPV